MKAAVFTLGCKVNQYESGAIVTKLREMGLDADEGLFAADLYVINTCSVTSEADKKSRQAISRALKFNHAAKIIILGCSSQNDAAPYFDKPEVVAVFGSGSKIQNISEAVTRLMLETGNNEGSKNAETEEDPSRAGEKKRQSGLLKLPRIYEDNMTPAQSKTRGYVKIQDGCDNFCSYCRVPYLRGRSRSRAEDAIITEALRFASMSKEIVLTGIDISSYGKNNGSSLPRLLALLGAELGTSGANEMTEACENGCACGFREDCGFNSEGNHERDLKNSLSEPVDAGLRKVYDGSIKKANAKTRVRLGSLECGAISDDLLKAMLEYGFCDHFHLSLQSGSDTVLKRMNRHYSAKEYLKKVDLIRKYFPYSGITTDIIAGFPEESVFEHKQTASFLRKVGFSDVHVFPYSPRKGTKAFDLPHLEKGVREERARELLVISGELKAGFIKRNLGRICEVLGEDCEQGYVTGLTSNYIKVYTGLASGEMGLQRLVEAFGAGVRGENID